MTPEQFLQNRKKLNLNQQSLAKLLQCSQPLISCYEKGAYEKGARSINGLRLEKFQELLKQKEESND